MRKIKCAGCGLVNWVEEGACRRCGAQLAFIEEVEAKADAYFERRPTGEGVNVCSFCGTEFKGFFCTLCRKPVRETRPLPDAPENSLLAPFKSSMKAKLVAAAAIVALVSAVALIVHLYGGSDASEFQSEIIKKADAFREPLTFSFAEAGKETAPGLKTLEELGYVRISVENLALRLDASGGEVWSAETGADASDASIIKRRSVARAELTEAGRAASAAWRSYEAKDASLGSSGKSRGWRVPLGEREFLAVTRVIPAAKGVFEASSVEFTWRWKPNEMGRRLDVSGPDFQNLTQAAQTDARRLVFNDSAKIYAGAATLRLEDGKWSVQDVSFAQTEKAAAGAR